MCKFSVSLINYALKTKRGYDQVDRIANNFCLTAHLESPLICSKISRLFNHEVTKVLSYGVVTPNQLCGLLSNNTCGHFHSPLDDWEVHLDASEGINRTKLELLRGQAVLNETSSDKYKVIHISDTHIDLNYAYGSPANCEEPLCCQVTSTPKNDSVDPGQQKAGYWGTYGLCDVPLRTFVATLKHLNETLQKSKDIEYIIWTGDIQPHDVWAQSKRTALLIYDTVFRKITKHLPNVIILPTLGNHEMIPADSFSPSNLLSIAKDDSPVWLYRKLDAFWSRWLPAETEATIVQDGFYAATIRPGLKVISLNTNFCHSRNFWLFINSTDPGNQLQWLVHELQLSELSHEKVHIIGHIPPGSDDCLRVWSKNYHRIVVRYADTITGQFFGHTHSSEFEMFYDDGDSKMDIKISDGKKDGYPTDNLTDESQFRPLSVAQVGPSITTFVDFNPSYRIYTIDPTRNYMPVDYETFYVNLTQANQAGKSAPPIWNSAGLFSEIFGINDISPSSMHQLMLKITNSFRLVEQVGSSDDFDESGYEEDEDGSENESDNVESAPEVTTNQKRSNLSSSARSFNLDDTLFKVYSLFNSYSDKFNRSIYNKISLDEKKKFVCRLLRGRSHDNTICKWLIPDMDIPKLVI